MSTFYTADMSSTLAAQQTTDGAFVFETYTDDNGAPAWEKRLSAKQSSPIDLGEKLPNGNTPKQQEESYLQRGYLVAATDAQGRKGYRCGMHEECKFNEVALHKRVDVIRHMIEQEFKDCKRWKCPYPTCDHTTKQKAQCESHINGRHQEVRFRCLMCADFICHDASQLSRHGKNEHNAELNKTQKRAAPAECEKAGRQKRKSEEQKAGMQQSAAQQGPSSGADGQSMPSHRQKKRKANVEAPQDLTAREPEPTEAIAIGTAAADAPFQQDAAPANDNDSPVVDDAQWARLCGETSYSSPDVAGFRSDATTTYQEPDDTMFGWVADARLEGLPLWFPSDNAGNQVDAAANQAQNFAGFESNDTRYDGYEPARQLAGVPGHVATPVQSSYGEFGTAPSANVGLDLPAFSEPFAPAVAATEESAASLDDEESWAEFMNTQF